MGNAARKARRARDRRQERDAVAVACAARGCSCRPGVEHYQKGGLNHVDVLHDDGCAAFDSGPMLVVTRGHRQSSAEFARDILKVLEAMR